MKETLRRVFHFGRRSQFDRELHDEIRFHLEARAEELRGEGWAPEAALDQARREFGPPARAAEDSRSAWQFQWLEDFWRDLVYGARAFRKSPGFTAVAILSLGIGVGANCVMFSIVDGTLLRPPKVPRPEELAAVISTGLDSNASGISYPDYLSLRDRVRSFSALAAFADVSTGIAMQPGAMPQTKRGKAVTDSFFELMGTPPALGRSFLPKEGNDLETVLGYTCWHNGFGGDPGALGKQVRINGVEFTVIGVMPRGFTDVDDDLMDDVSCFYVPLRAAARIGGAPDLEQNRAERFLTVFGRMKAGVPVTRAQAEVSTIAQTLEQDFPATNKNRSMLVRNVAHFRAGGSAGITMGSIAMVLSALVLLIACANVAGLLTSRAPSRAKEMAMRLAIGAGRGRLIRQLLTESMLLALGGAVLGVILGDIPIELGRNLADSFDATDPQSFPIHIDMRVLLFSVLLALASVLLFGLLPAFRATRASLTSAMKTGDATPRRSWLRKVLPGHGLLVAVQVAISLLLLTTSAVLYAGVYKGFVASVRNPGFQMDRRLDVDFTPANMHFKDARARQFFMDLVARLNRTGGVKSATAFYQDAAMIRPDSPKAHDNVGVSGVWATETFFDALGIQVPQGHAFQAADLLSAPSVAVINNVLADRYWPGQSAVGKRIKLSSGQWVTVVGVANLKAFMAFGTPPLDTIFLPYGTPPHRDVRLIVHTSGDPVALVQPLRAILRDLDPDQALPEAYSMQTQYATILRAAFLGLNTFGLMGLLGLILALTGLYGLVAFQVSSRTREIGIRMALGARASAVVGMVLRQGIALAVFGVGAGIALNWGVVRILAAFLGNPGADNAANSPPPPNTGSEISMNAGTASFGGTAFTVLVIIVLVVTILAAWLPARRAARVDPNVALRAE